MWGGVLVEYRDATQRARRPFFMILVEVWVDRLKEGADEGNLP